MPNRKTAEVHFNLCVFYIWILLGKFYGRCARSRLNIYINGMTMATVVRIRSIDKDESFGEDGRRCEGEWVENAP